VSDHTDPDEAEVIAIQGAREHNLKNISLTIPRNKFVVITGVSGSGKSTLAFDLLFAEGQRRFLDSMNAYARQFVEQMGRPDVDLITGLPPSVSIEQRNSRGGGKSTVATVTEIYHFIRLLYARLGTQFCPKCQVPVTDQTVDAIGAKIQTQLKSQKSLTLLAPVVRNRKGFHSDVAVWAAKNGFARLRADKKFYPADEPFRLDRFREHDVEVVVAEFKRGGKSPDKSSGDLMSAVKSALDLGQGTLLTLGADKTETVYSTQRTCPGCGESFPTLDPKNFSYNSARGWCSGCRGFGETFYLPDVDRGARAESIEESWFEWQDGKREICPDCDGDRLNLHSRNVRLTGARFKPGVLGETADQRVHGPSIVQLGNASVLQALAFFSDLLFGDRRASEIARDIIPEIRERLKFLSEVGLDYLELGRNATTLSGGEAQRIRLAAQLGSNLTGVLYILDEPTIGLHPRDNEHLLRALDLLQNRGNSLVVVEHDDETMRRADHIIDLGPGAGVLGGMVVAQGDYQSILANPASLTGRHLEQKRKFPSTGERRSVTMANTRGKRAVYAKSALLTPVLTVNNASLHNLKSIKVDFPLNRFVVVTGVSGSGKSTLIRECLVPGMRSALSGKGAEAGLEIIGAGSIKAVYEVDQSPIGRTPRSTPATYVGFFDDIRQIFSQTTEAKMRGYSPSRFSFNSVQGRCPVCEGAGHIKLEMNFLPPAFVTCESCEGSRYNSQTLEVAFKEKNIAEVLNLSVAEALEFFSAHQKIVRPLQALFDTGLSYLRLGQTSPTLSGGEAQRIKLVSHLLSGLGSGSKRLPTKRSTAALALNESLPAAQRPPIEPHFLFVLEEPTIGLHMADVHRLCEVLQRLVNAGHSVIVIEHNLDLIAEADWLIDLGPEAGKDGGSVVAVGTPEQLASHSASHTGRFLKELFKRHEA